MVISTVIWRNEEQPFQYPIDSELWAANNFRFARCWLFSFHASFVMLPLVYCIVSDIPYYLTAQLPKCDKVHSRNVVHGDLTGVRTLRSIIYVLRLWLICPSQTSSLMARARHFSQTSASQILLLKPVALHMSHHPSVDLSVGPHQNIFVSRRATVFQRWQPTVTFTPTVVSCCRHVQ
jgi:hypothetical protein